jgi:hypothetical protein
MLVDFVLKHTSLDLVCCLCLCCPPLVCSFCIILFWYQISLKRNGYHVVKI